MYRPKEKALEVTTELVKARLSNTNISVTADGGKDTADYFQAIYDKVLEITEQIVKNDL